MMFLVSSSKDTSMYVRVKSFDTTIKLCGKVITAIVRNYAKKYKSRICTRFQTKNVCTVPDFIIHTDRT